MNRNFGGVVSEINAVLEAIALFHTRNIANPLVIIIRVAKASVINLLYKEKVSC
ncbi:hypothetical protein [Nostoc commune]|uniref:hypothetical protein n=1 Tax=Nostoc commune TaxID=1178 RepID=UPI0020740B84|nr:hypothetical protein [Nostoc commune]